MLSEIVVEKSVLPDIIVHHRGQNNKNLLIIEVKKSTSSVSEEYDIEKLKCYTELSNQNNLKYKYGVFIKFYTCKSRYQAPDIKYFEKGREILCE